MALIATTDVREYLRLTDKDNRGDALIGKLITRATAALEAYMARELTPSTATRRFLVDDTRLISLGRRDLRSVTTLTLHPAETEAVTLAADVDYALEPEDGILGTFKAVRLAPGVSLDSSRAATFGAARVEIVGAWGVAAYPDDLVQAALVTVGTWWRRDVAATTIEGSDQVDVAPVDRLPADARMLVRPYRYLSTAAA